jgi:hypothetical protein
MIEEQLDDVPLASGPGHDGQIYYAMALDLDGDEVGPLLDHAAYRYRRILYPLLGSLFGLLEGMPLLIGLIGLNVIAFAVATGYMASMSARAGRSELMALVVLLNPGTWLSVQLLTSDILALALMIGALELITRRATWSGGAVFGLSALAKDVFIATPVPLAVPNVRRRWPIAMVPIGALLAWMTLLTLMLGDGFAARGNLDWPIMGLVDASANWPVLDGKEILYLVVALAFVVVGVMFSLRRSWLRWPIASWTLLALVSSNWVWDFGNNAVRAFAPIAILVALSGSQVEADAVSTSADLTTAGS